MSLNANWLTYIRTVWDQNQNLDIEFASTTQHRGVLTEYSSFRINLKIAPIFNQCQ